MHSKIQRLSLVLVMMLACFGAGCGDKTGARSLETGMRKLSQKDIPGAIRSLRAAVAARPHDPTALCNLGIAYAVNGQHADAIALFGQAALEIPDDPHPHELITHSFLALNNPDDARKAAQRALQLTPESPARTTLMACVEQKAGNTTLAKKYLTQALELDKDYPPALYDLGMLYRQQANRQDLANDLLRRYLQHAGNDPQAATVRDLLAAKVEPPLPETTRAPTADNTDTSPSAAPTPPPRSRAEVADVPSTPPPPPVVHQPQRDKRSEAMEFFTAGLAAQKDGKTKTAIQLYENAIRIDPSLARAAYNLGLLYLSSHKNEQAQQAFETAIRADSRMERAYLQAAVAAMNRKQNVEALQHVTTLLRFAPNNVEARYLAGVASVNIGRRDAARTHFAAYLKMAPKGPMAGYIRTWMKQQP